MEGANAVYHVISDMSDFLIYILYVVLFIYLFILMLLLVTFFKALSVWTQTSD